MRSQIGYRYMIVLYNIIHPYALCKIIYKYIHIHVPPHTYTEHTHIYMSDLRMNNGFALQSCNTHKLTPEYYLHNTITYVCI